MAKFCTECGKEIASGVAFCTECGTKAPADSAPETAAEVKTEVRAETKPEPAVHTAPANTYQAQQSYNPPAQTAYAPPAPDPTSKVVGTGAYFGLMLLFGIPVIGLIACIIMAFAPKNKNIKHFARAMLIWTVIALVLVGILVAVISLLTNSLMDYINQLTDGQFSDFGDLFGQLGDLEGLMEQYQNGGGLEGLPVE